jgi:hypothetical protein
MAASFLASSVWFAGSTAPAQGPSTPSSNTPDSYNVLHYRKPASSSWVYASQPTQPLNQPATERGMVAEEDLLSLYGLGEAPGPQRVFRLDSEAQLQERWRQQARDLPVPERIQFPDESVAVVGQGPYQGRHFPQRDMLVEPSYVCYGRLFFEDVNSERYGWDLGFFQPFWSAGIFYWQLATLSYHIGAEPCRWHDCSSGYCLPGDPVPYLIYPPQLSVTGAAAEAATIIGLLAVFP